MGQQKHSYGELGTSAVEYALLLAFVAIVSILSVEDTGVQIAAHYKNPFPGHIEFDEAGGGNGLNEAGGSENTGETGCGEDCDIPGPGPGGDMQQYNG